MVNRDDIFPPDHGAAVRIDQVARGLSRHLDSVYLITDERRRYHAYRAGERFEVLFPDWLSRLGPPHRWVKDCVEREMGVPDTESFLYFPLVDWSYIVRTAYVAFRHPSGTYLAEGYPAFARPCLWGRRIFGGKVILSEHNVEYERLATQYQLAPRATEALRHIELLMCNEADAVVTVSDGDRRQLVSSGVDERRIHVVPHGVDLRSFEHAQALDLHAKFGLAPETQILVYHGAYTYSPNLDAVRIFATEILPHLRAAGCQPKLIAIGRNAGVAWTHDDVLFAGPVDNVAPYLLAADLAVVPLRHGGGTRMKILDYFAAGLPVVSTTKGAEGTTAESGVHLVIEDEPEQFAQAVLHLLHNPEDAARLGATSRAFVERRGWDAVIAQYAALMG